MSASLKIESLKTASLTTASAQTLTAGNTDEPDTIDPEPPSRSVQAHFDIELIYDDDTDDADHRDGVEPLSESALKLRWQALCENKAGTEARIDGGIEGAVEACGRAIVAQKLGVGTEPSRVTILLSTDASVRALNKTYRGKDAATNVLSFPSPPMPGQSEMDVRHLGDVILALETLTVEAADQGIVPLHHLQHLVVHGVLHVLGFDHETDAEALVMEGLETKILAHMGLPDPYVDPPQ
jgi:probable rRNA maturation factor